MYNNLRDFKSFLAPLATQHKFKAAETYFNQPGKMSVCVCVCGMCECVHVCVCTCAHVCVGGATEEPILRCMFYIVIQLSSSILSPSIRL